MKSSTILVALALTSFGWADDDDNLLPVNRPNFSSNAEVVPPKMVIFEMGSTYQKVGGSQTLSGIEGQLRMGLCKGWQVDFFLPGYTSVAAPRGWTDSGVQILHQLPSAGGFNFLVAAGTTIPSGQVDLTGGAFNPNFYFSLDHDLGKDLSFTNTFYVNWQHSGSVFLPNYANAAMVSKDLGHGNSAFLELYSTFAPATTSAEILNMGYIFAHNENQQVDFHFGRSFVGGPSDNWFFGAGYSVKLSK